MKPLIYRLAEKLVEKTESLVDLRIDEYCVCLRSAYVVVSDGRGRRGLGMAHIPRIELHRYGETRPPVIEELPEIVVSTNSVTRILGVTALNAVSQYLLYSEIKRAGRTRGSLALEAIRIGGEPVCLIGNMGPLARDLEGRGFTVWRFEKDPLLRGPNCMSDAEELYLGPRCGTMFITGMTLLNWSIDYIIDMKGPYKVLLGPTAGILPSLLRGEGIDAVASFHPARIDELIEHLRLGGYIAGPDQPRFGIPYVYYPVRDELLVGGL